MDNRGSNELLAKLATLSGQERKVLRLRCTGLDYVEIGKQLFVSKYSVREYMGRIYVKLGIDQMSRTQRTKTLFDTICPVFEASELPPEPAVEVEEPIPEAVEGMVDEDENAIILVRPTAYAPTPPPVQRKGRGGARTIAGIFLGVVLGICLSTIAVVLILRSNILAGITGTGSTPTAQITLGEPQESPSPVPEIAAQTPVIIEQVVVVTATSLPITPSPTQAPLPSIPLPFSDNFELRARPEWETITGTWRVLDGHFTGENNDQWQIVFVGDPNCGMCQ